MILEIAAFAQLAAACAPSVAPETLAAVARVESGFDPEAINLNGPGGGRQRVSTREEAIALATELVVVRRRSVDLGLMQINSANLAGLRMTIADAFDPCRNLAAAARLLAGGYAAASRSDADPQHALRGALSRYNTGHPERGFANGYVRRVETSAEQVVPAIRLRSEGAPALVPAKRADSATPPSAPPAWDVFGQAQAPQHVYRAAQPPNPVQAEPDASLRTASR